MENSSLVILELFSSDDSGKVREKRGKRSHSYAAISSVHLVRAQVFSGKAWRFWLNLWKYGGSDKEVY
jgi:hypothetical protein